MDKEMLRELSSRSFIEISNSFSGAFFASQETCIWYIKAEHCTHRGFCVQCEGKNLEDLVKIALEGIIEIEQLYSRKKEGLSILYPEKDEYDIAELARQEMSSHEQRNLNSNS